MASTTRTSSSSRITVSGEMGCGAVRAGGVCAWGISKLACSHLVTKWKRFVWLPMRSPTGSRTALWFSPVAAPAPDELRPRSCGARGTGAVATRPRSLSLHHFWHLASMGHPQMDSESISKGDLMNIDSIGPVLSQRLIVPEQKRALIRSGQKISGVKSSTAVAEATHIKNWMLRTQAWCCRRT